jgi:co-chaperonin GroES (HSP10)
MAKVKGKIIPLGDKILISDMEFGMEVTKSGILLHSDNAKAHGVRPRWGKVWAIGPDQTDVKIGEWILLEHGRWTRTFEIEQEDGTILEVRGVDNKAIMLCADEKPDDVQRKAL